MRTTTDPIQAHRFFSFLRKTLGFYLKKKFKTEVLKENTFKAPYVLLANHINSYDPFVLASFIDHPVNYVVSDTWFRKPLLRFLLNRVGGIPKTKYLSDMTTAKTLINVKKNNGIIGIFPEGARSWDGKTLPIIFSTAKLIKLLKIDVVTAKFEGMMFTMPRWSRYNKRGKTYLSFDKIIDASDIAGMSVEDIYNKICGSIEYDEYTFQRKTMLPYTGKRPAERLERFLYFCPSCRGFHTMKSKKDIFRCIECGYEVRYNKYGFFEGKNVIFDDTHKWNEFQIIETKKMLASDFSIDAKRVIMSIGSKEFSRLRKIKIGHARFSSTEFYFQNLKKHKYIFDINKLSGINIQSNHILEFYQDKTLYRIDFMESNISAYAAKKILIGSKTNGGKNE